MRVPAEISTFCPRCGKHTPHSVSTHKRGKPSKASWGERRHEAEKHGYGGQKYPIQRKHAKATKKQTLRLKCKECGYTLVRKGMRGKVLKIGEGT
ncbi:MAG: 50S ribosomal protein L44e [Candidatus Bathyarchaeia archaeon]